MSTENRLERFVADQVEATKLARDSLPSDTSVPIRVDAFNAAFSLHRHGTDEGTPIDLDALLRDAARIEAYLRG